MPSFDIVSEVDVQEVDNAVNQSSKEIANRFDFKGSKSSITFDRTKKVIDIIAGDDLKMRAIHTILEGKVAKRGIDIRSLSYGDVSEISGNLLKQQISLRAGIDKEDAKKITKKIKESKLKVQPQVQDEKVRVTGKKIDDLQKVIALLKEGELEIPLQYINMRS